MSAALPKPDDGPLDAVVIGGGPGGLTGALYLARFRRRVLVIDSGNSRAANIPCSHNYPGFPRGVAGTALLHSMRQQVGRHEVPVRSGHVDSIQRSDGVFTLEGTPFGECRARTVLLATGAADVWPDLPAAAEALRDGVLRFCPVCDGYEASDRSVGVLTNGSAGVHEALYLRHFTPKVTVFLCADDVVLTADELRSLRDAGVAVAEAPPSAFSRTDGGVTVTHGDKRSTCSAVYSSFGLNVRSRLALTIGAACDASGYLVVDEHHRTSVEGLYAVGDVAKGLNQISVATGGAAIAASAMHLALRQMTP
jgi:thioredoxin reductase (NADPH)